MSVRTTLHRTLNHRTIARRRARIRRMWRTHRTTGRTASAAILAGALLLGGVGASLATAADSGAASPAPDAATAPVDPSADASVDPATDPTADPTADASADPSADAQDDADGSPDMPDVPDLTADELDAEVALADADLEARAAQMAERMRAKSVRSKIIAVARAQIGDRYVPGRTGPDAFDCSGLTRYVFKQVTGIELPHYSRAQYRTVKRIKLSEAQPGDLVFFLRRGAHHVGIYIGNGKMIDAPGRGHRVRVSPIDGSWWGRTYTGIGRVVDPV